MSKKSWIASTINFIFWIALRAAANHLLSGLRTALDFAALVKNFKNGDIVRGVINLLLGVLGLVTVTALTAVADIVEDLTKQAIKEAVAYVAEMITPTTERRATNEVGNDLVARNLAVEEVFSGDMTTFTRMRKAAVLVTSEGVGELIIESFSITHYSRR